MAVTPHKNRNTQNVMKFGENAKPVVRVARSTTFTENANLRPILNNNITSIRITLNRFDTYTPTDLNSV